MNFNKLFQNHCKKNNLEINSNQLKLINELNNFYNFNFKKSILNKIFSNKNSKPGFYLYGDVGVGKTMILNLTNIEFILMNLWSVFMILFLKIKKIKKKILLMYLWKN